MSAMLLIMMAFLLAVVGIGASVFGVYLGRRELPRGGDRGGANRLLAEQGQRIDQLEKELRHLQDQADFTQKLLGERVVSQDEP